MLQTLSPTQPLPPAAPSPPPVPTAAGSVLLPCPPRQSQGGTRCWRGPGGGGLGRAVGLSQACHLCEAPRPTCPASLSATGDAGCGAGSSLQLGSVCARGRAISPDPIILTWSLHHPDQLESGFAAKMGVGKPLTNF